VANTLSTAKRARQNEVRRLRNAAIKSKVRTLTKKFIHAIEAKDPDSSVVERCYRSAIREYDRAWTRKVLKRENASRHIARLSKRFNAFQEAHS
jgi:small subunit ribosomal protein S20